MTGPSPGHGYVPLPTSDESVTSEEENAKPSDAIDDDDQCNENPHAQLLLVQSRDPFVPVSLHDAVRLKDDMCGNRSDSNASDSNEPEASKRPDSEESRPQSSFIDRLGIVATIPHLAVLLALVLLVAYTVINIRAENARQLKTEDLEKRSAFVYLVTANVTKIDNLGFSIQSLNKYFKTDMNYQIVIVHDDIPPLIQGRLQALSEAPLRFREHPLRGPNDLNMSATVSTAAEMIEWNKHRAVRFWFHTSVLAEPTKKGIFSDLDYVVRLDPDSVFTGEIGRDVIREFVLSGAQYGYQSIGKDCRKNETYGIKELAESYVDLNGITARSINLWASLMRAKTGGCLPKFESHFEMINMRFFRSHSGIQDWIRVVDANGGIYRQGWGEAALRYITVALYAAPEKLVRYGNDVVPYKHPLLTKSKQRL